MITRKWAAMTKCWKLSISLHLISKLLKYRNRKNLKHDCTFFLGYLLLNIDKSSNLPLHIFLDFDKVRLDYLIALQHLDDLFLKPETEEYTIPYTNMYESGGVEYFTNFNKFLWIYVLEIQCPKFAV